MKGKSMNLKRNQLEFLRWLHEDGSTGHNFSRNYLRTIAMKHGMAWAPAWIVKDKSRIISRGLYAVPEYAEYVKSLSPNSATDAANAATPNMAGSI